MKILIKGGRVIDPANGIDATLDILVEEGKISKIDKAIQAAGAEVIDAAGKLVTPGLVDIHVHLRDPGYEYKEDVVSGTRAAVAGGFTAVACMPNTSPVNDNKAVTLYIRHKAQEQGACRVYPVGSITKGLKGESLSEMGDLKEAGCVAFSDDGRPVCSGEMMRRALEYARPFGMPLISHAEDLSLVGEGVMNDGFVATELGLKGIPWVAEDASTARDVMLAEFTGSRLHVAHVSTKGSVEIIRAAKKRGVKVTCEATPHHFTLTDEAVRGYDTNAKMNPPLRGAEDVAAVRAGLADGTIDAIATDHAPHHYDEKNVEFNIALNGIVGLETALPLTLRLVDEGVLPLSAAVDRLTCGPARALGLPGGTLETGAAADITVIDPELKWTVEAAKLNSKSKNTPFDGWKMKGAAIHTMVGGKVVYKREG
ncbi:dihydroorotase [Desulfuromonas versatilis]|uniref:Dihydroorotase n=1 Tax=Desulfuromonas versatilis TaxID=2802975 RepID=A0ABN6DY63_9BACT|nr:dihydroorotase [Desulfuromonas versatilis]BCR04995.1 dihydroorotase [Desulfuromonas versatilis]